MRVRRTNDARASSEPRSDRAQERSVLVSGMDRPGGPPCWASRSRTRCRRCCTTAGTRRPGWRTGGTRRSSAPRRELPDLLAGLGPQWAGLSLTMPLKEVALAVADEVDSRARRRWARPTRWCAGRAAGSRTTPTRPAWCDALAAVGVHSGLGRGARRGRHGPGGAARGGPAGLRRGRPSTPGARRPWTSCARWPSASGCDCRRPWTSGRSPGARARRPGHLDGTQGRRRRAGRVDWRPGVVAVRRHLRPLADPAGRRGAGRRLPGSCPGSTCC